MDVISRIDIGCFAPELSQKRVTNYSLENPSAEEKTTILFP
jgi:hypothetical protein